MLLVVELMANKLGLNSRNSSIPPSQDINRKKPATSKRTVTGKKPGGQPGHIGSTLEPVDHPDEVVTLPLDKRSLPKGECWESVGYEARQVIELHIQRKVVEYQAQIMRNQRGQQRTATFPADAKRPIQYGHSVIAHAVYLSMYQLIPYERLQNQFQDMFGIDLSMGTLVNFNQQLAQRLHRVFKPLAIEQIALADVACADETGVNINASRHWVHGISSTHWALLTPHKQRGVQAMKDIGVLPRFKGVLVHDHWSAYLQFECQHQYCNAHYLRELIRAHEQDDCRWAKLMHALLLKINQAVTDAGGELSESAIKGYRKRYRSLITRGEKESPVSPSEAGKRGRPKQSKARNLLDRLRIYEDDTLRFMTDAKVPFTNNQGEREIRMLKVQQKISGCFRSAGNAENYCLFRSYLSSCLKHGVSASEGINLLARNEWPEFIKQHLR